MKVVLAILAAILGILAVVGGFGIGLGMIAYSIYLIVLMAKGTIAVSFLKILGVVALWVFAGLAGWLWAIVVGFLASCCAAGAGADMPRRRLW